MIFKRFRWLVLFAFLLCNLIVFNHAYKFTHFSENGKRIRPENLDAMEKLDILFFGIENPRPENDKVPNQEYETVALQSKELLEGWLVENEKQKGIVILFHGYSASKSGCLAYAEEFYQMGFSTLLVDFQGSGGSTGNNTTVGFEESKDVKVAFEYIQHRLPNVQIILFGSSMGAASILKAIDDFDIGPDKIILECPFGTMKATMQKRFQAMGIPSFPAAEILLLYGGAINGFNAFKHNPVDYAKAVKIPTLLLHGENDKRVLVPEVREIFENLNGPKELIILSDCGHEVYLECNPEKWSSAVRSFLK
ncbi:MAG: alpha/beta hydrolase [Saprospiraceae bacterium]